MKSDNIKRIIWAAASIFILCIGFFICRYLLFDLHGMGEWPLDLFVFGLIVICASGLFNGKKIMICTALGYIISFFMALLFSVDWIDANGFARSSLWIWWTIAMVTFVIIGAIWEIISKIIKARFK